MHVNNTYFLFWQTWHFGWLKKIIKLGEILTAMYIIWEKFNIYNVVFKDVALSHRYWTAAIYRYNIGFKSIFLN